MAALPRARRPGDFGVHKRARDLGRRQGQGHLVENARAAARQQFAGRLGQACLPLRRRPTPPRGLLLRRRQRQARLAAERARHAAEQRPAAESERRHRLCRSHDRHRRPARLRHLRQRRSGRVRRCRQARLGEKSRHSRKHLRPCLVADDLQEPAAGAIRPGQLPKRRSRSCWRSIRPPANPFGRPIGRCRTRGRRRLWFASATATR